MENDGKAPTQEERFFSILKEAVSGISKIHNEELDTDGKEKWRTTDLNFLMGFMVGVVHEQDKEFAHKIMDGVHKRNEERDGR